MENKAFDTILNILPAAVKRNLLRLSDETLSKIAEIRLRAGNITTVTIDGENLYLTDTGLMREGVRCVRVSAHDIEDFLYRLCGGSVYAYENTVESGFITRGGVRAGLCGNALIKDGKVNGFSEITGVNLRIPHHIPGCAKELLTNIAKHGFSDGGILVISPPGVGKTTLLRDLAIGLSRDIRTKYRGSHIYRVCIIDERSEIYIPECFSSCAVDVFSGMSKKKALECAARSMAPEVIICDEIGSSEDAEIIRNAHFGGCAFAASMHGASMKDILTKQSVCSLIENGVFGHFYVLSRKNGKVQGELFDRSFLSAPC